MTLVFAFYKAHCSRVWRTNSEIHIKFYFWTLEVGTFISVGFNYYQTSFEDHCNLCLGVHLWESGRDMNSFGQQLCLALNLDLEKIEITSHSILGHLHLEKITGRTALKAALRFYCFELTLSSDIPQIRKCSMSPRNVMCLFLLFSFLYF